MADEIPLQVRDARREISALADARSRLVQSPAQPGTRTDTTALTNLDRSIAAALERVRDLIDPCDASPTEPLVLLPVRLETRFADQGGATVLKVRIFPDEIHVDDLVRGLTADEISAGQQYWTAVWTDHGDSQPQVAAEAFAALTRSVAPARVDWVAHQCRPTNLAGRGTGAPQFATPDAPAARNVIARALPDRFVVVVHQGPATSSAVGNPVPRDLPMNPIPLGSEQADADPTHPSIPVGSRWLVDFDEAVKVGMGVVVRLPGGRAPISRVVAIGTRAAASPLEGAQELEDLLTGHRFSGGLSLMPQGTPTNNADASRSPYRSRPQPTQPTTQVPTPVPGSDTVALAGTVGLDPTVLTDLLGAGTGEQAIAKSVNTCLWAPGWGEYLSRLDAHSVPGLGDGQRESARRLFRDQVRGRGPSPAIRVRAQPYGVLPVSDPAAWHPAAGETTAGIQSVLVRLLGRWRAAAGRVAAIRPDQPGLDAAFLEIMGTAPVQLGLRARPFLTDDVSQAVTRSLGVDPAIYQAEIDLQIAVIAQTIGAAARNVRLGSLHPKDRPVPLPLASDRDPDFINALLGSPSQVIAVDSVLQALLALAWQSAELDAVRAAPTQFVPTLAAQVTLEGAVRESVNQLLGQVDTATPGAFRTAADQVAAAHGVTPSGPSTARKYLIDENSTNSLAQVVLAGPPLAQTQAVAAGVLAGWLAAMGYRAEVRDGMRALLTTSTADRSLAVGEALDCSSHRLDAWVTAVASDRLSARGGARGATIGAYGVVENLSPAAPGSRSGWLQAPTPRHAVAAGILRAAHLAHLPATGSGGPFEMDLSSNRLPAALRAIEAIKQGQQLAAVLGYQIERGLADARLSRLALSLRTLAPLVARRLTDVDGADSDTAKEAIAANNVVDGMLLLEKFPPGMPTLRAALATPPVNAYLDPNDWTPLTDPEWASVTAIMRAAADTADAVADILLSESVLQYASGNAARAAAAMDAMSSAGSPASELDILETDDSAERLTHRVLALVGSGAANSQGPWPTDRPRALAEPYLEAWVAARLGSPTTIVVAEADPGTGTPAITLDAAHLCALDLVYSKDLTALEQILRHQIPTLAGRELAVLPGRVSATGERTLGQVMVLAASLLGLIGGATALLPESLTRPGESASRDLAGSIPELVARLTNVSTSLRNTLSAIAPVIAGLPADGIVADEASGVPFIDAVIGLTAFGVDLTPSPTLPLDLSWTRSAYETASARATNCAAALAGLAGQPATTPANLLLDAAQQVSATIFGEGFLVVPLLPAAADGFATALDNPAFATPSRSAVRRLVRDLGTVREQVQRYSEVLLTSGALGSADSPSAVQLTERGPGGPAVGTTRWLAGRFDPDQPWPASPAAHLLIDAVALGSGGSAMAGLTIDAWVEDLPALPRPPLPGQDVTSVPAMATSALALQAESASARAPQAILSAVSPDGRRWTTGSLAAVIDATLDLARIRLVRLDQLAGEALALPALYVRSSSLQGQSAIDFTALIAASRANIVMPFVKEP